MVRLEKSDTWESVQSAINETDGDSGSFFMEPKGKVVHNYGGRSSSGFVYRRLMKNVKMALVEVDVNDNDILTHRLPYTIHNLNWMTKAVEGGAPLNVAFVPLDGQASSSAKLAKEVKALLSKENLSSSVNLMMEESTEEALKRLFSAYTTKAVQPAKAAGDAAATKRGSMLKQAVAWASKLGTKSTKGTTTSAGSPSSGKIEDSTANVSVAA
jgi:hypothetical protein